jgi:hypothetical protein
VSVVADAVDTLRRNYRPAFLRYLPRREEAALHDAYELGRAALADSVSLLDLVQVHHGILIEVLRDTAPADMEQTAAAASEFLVEVLAIYDMAQRRHEP